MQEFDVAIASLLLSLLFVVLLWNELDKEGTAAVFDFTVIGTGTDDGSGAVEIVVDGGTVKVDATAG